MGNQSEWNKKTSITEISTEVLDKKSQPIDEKSFFNIPNKSFLSLWMPRLKTDSTNIPLKNAIVPQNKHAKVTSWVNAAIGYMYCNSNDMQNAAKQTALTSSVFSTGNGFYVIPENLWQAAVIFAVRRLIKPTWLNDCDQFLQPTASLNDEFKTDCLMWMLFNDSNLTASANDLEWNHQTWSIVNHFIPFTEVEVNAPARFESDFMVQYLANLPPLPNPPPQRGEGANSAAFRHGAPLPNPPPRRGGVISLSLDGIKLI